MYWSLVRRVVSCLLLAIFPVSMVAADTAAGILYSKGTTWVNGSAVPSSIAVFPGDLVQTQSGAVANLNASGSSVVVLAESLIKVQPGAVSLEHGSVQVATHKRMTAHAGIVTITPASDGWTNFDVADTDGTVKIMARKGDLTVTSGSETTTLSEGQSTTRDDTPSSEDSPQKHRRRKGGGAIPAGTGGALDSPLAIGIGVGATGALLGWVLTRDDEPLSPSKP